MNLKPKPFILYIKVLLQFIDNALADITEWSDIVRKYTNINAHDYSLNAISGFKRSKNPVYILLYIYINQNKFIALPTQTQTHIIGV
jgi:hypothetical protein